MDEILCEECEAPLWSAEWCVDMWAGVSNCPACEEIYMMDQGD